MNGGMAVRRDAPMSPSMNYSTVPLALGIHIMEERTIAIGGRTSRVCLEEQFWDCLEDIASQRDMSLHRLVTEIGGTCSDLSSALRVHVLAHYQRMAGFDLIELTVPTAICDGFRKYH
jgi:predicted DNA-binding ribbon-helix-helix protein